MNKFQAIVQFLVNNYTSVVYGLKKIVYIQFNFAFRQLSECQFDDNGNTLSRILIK